jgi:rod shape-determining protein MreB
MDVKGRDAISGLPRTVSVSANQLSEALRPELMRIVATVKAVMEETPPELASDIIDKGVVMTGGTSLLRNFSHLLTAEIGVPFHVSEEALLCVARGTGIALENIDLYKRSLHRR